MDEKAIMDRLEAKALHYLGRYAATARRLETVLTRFARKRLADEDKESMARLITQKVAECRERGYIDDAAFAARRAGMLRLKGASVAAIRRKLGEYGVAKDVIAETLTEQDTSDDAEMRAALILARRRRLGPYCGADARREGWQTRHLGRLARAGFSAPIARRVMAFASPDEAEDWLHAAGDS